jgi:Ca2+/Na+ antiporter
VKSIEGINLQRTHTAKAELSIYPHSKVGISTMVFDISMEPSSSLPTSLRNKRNNGAQDEELVINTPFGCLRGKFYVKAAAQSVLLVAVMCCFGLAHFVNRSMMSMSMMNEQEEDLSLFDIDIDSGRSLQDANGTIPPSVDPECKAILENMADPTWMAAFLALGVMYMFLALAIACDEFFVPALEEMSSPRRLNLSMDVAGATLMAAGGSAPELFTALFGTFSESSIGFGTIVGSAVFNVLFVIAMCSLLANEVLQLTWWPLFRDSFYYIIGLGVLALFVGFVTKDEIYIWEACVLFSLYLGYILLMWQNANLYKCLTGKTLGEYEEDEDGPVPTPPPTESQTNPEESPTTVDEEGQENNMTGIKRQTSKSASLSSNLTSPALHHGHHPAHFRWQGTFRAGILKLLKDPDSWMDTAGVGIVAKIAGDADYVFAQVDIDGNGHVDREELKQLFNLLECYISPRELEEVFNQLDQDKDGTVRTQHHVSYMDGCIHGHIHGWMIGIYLKCTCLTLFPFPSPFFIHRSVNMNSPNGTAVPKNESCHRSIMFSTKLMSTSRIALTRMK